MNERQWLPVEETAHLTPTSIPSDLILRHKPLVMRGLVQSWPAVKDSGNVPRLINRIKQAYNGRPAMIYQAPPGVSGRFAYGPDLTHLNYESVYGSVSTMLDEITETLNEANPPSRYVASNQLQTHFPGLLCEHSLRFPPAITHPEAAPPLASIWMGNHSIACAHFDALENIACCVAGERRFNLFPPEQIKHLYPGPLHLTPGGQPVTLVDIHNPDLQKFPEFARAREHGYEVTLKPGDAIYIPSMWWHQVEGLHAFNIMINHWWSMAPDYLAGGMSALLHSILAIRDKPVHEKKAWKAIFDYYIFSASESNADHIPEEARGPLATLDENTARQLRAILIRQLNQ